MGSFCGSSLPLKHYRFGRCNHDPYESWLTMWSFSLKDTKVQNIRVFATIRQSEIEGALQSLKLTYGLHTLMLWIPGGDIYMLGTGTLHLSFGTIRKALYFSSLTRLFFRMYSSCWPPKKRTDTVSVKSIDVELKFAAIFDGSVSHLLRTTQSLNFVQAAVARCQDGSNPYVQVYPNPEKRLSPKSTHTIWLFVP